MWRPCPPPSKLTLSSNVFAVTVVFCSPTSNPSPLPLLCVNTLFETVMGPPEENLPPPAPFGTLQKSWLLYVTVLRSNVVPAFTPQNPAWPLYVRVLLWTSFGIE